MQLIHQSFSVNFQFPVYFTENLFTASNPTVADFLARHSRHLPARVLWVVDDGVTNAWPNLPTQLEAYCQAHAEKLKLTGKVLSMPGGEAAKNDTSLIDQLLEAVNTLGIDRHAYIAAIGGGALLDMVGYAAAIAHRGIRLLRFPTTVLSQNDSGIGVKNGVNAFGKKNFIGTFAPPSAVFNDFNFLATLHERDWRAGIAEAVKVALIKDQAFFEELEQKAASLANRELEPMKQLIVRCAQLHMEHIAGGDPFEMGSSRPLDFGHWAAHKLEQLTNYELRHGEAVAIGIALDVTYSQHIGLLSREELQRILGVLQTLGFRIYHPALAATCENGQELAVIAGLEEFREHLGGQLTIMLLERIGKGVEVNQVATAKMMEAVEYLAALHPNATIEPYPISKA